MPDDRNLFGITRCGKKTHIQINREGKILGGVRTVFSFPPIRVRQYIPPEDLYISSKLHDVTSKSAVIYIVPPAETYNSKN
jgi:hypothetical protein